MRAASFGLILGCTFASAAWAEPFTITDDTGSRQGTRFRVTAVVRHKDCGAHCSIAAVGGPDLAVARIRFGK